MATTRKKPHKPRNLKLWLIAALTLLSLWMLAPSLIHFAQPPDKRNDPEYMRGVIPGWLPASYMHLGLDLQGGVQLVLGVQMSEAVENRLGRVGAEIMRLAGEQDLPIKSAYLLKGQSRLRVELNPGADPARVVGAVTTEYPGLVAAAQSATAVDFVYRADQVESIQAGALDQAERVIRNRVDKWGVTEPLINRRADDSIMVQLPGFQNPKEAVELLGRTAQLQFKLVDDHFNAFAPLADKLPPGIAAERGEGGTVALVSEDRPAIVALTRGLIPPDRQLLFSEEPLAGGRRHRYHTVVVEATAQLTGEDIVDARVTQGASRLENRPAVALQLTGLGAKTFADLTGANIGRRLAIVLDEVVVSAPMITSRIPGGHAEITMGTGRGYQETIREAQQLALVLKSGALPASINVLEQRQVGASLGPELAREGLLGVACGLALVFLYMTLYYRRPGVIACVALALNGIFLAAVMVSFGAALTLPGIAAFVLALGMAVDANVLINERFRQELREGKAPRVVVDIGFKKVFWTVFDGHFTAILAAAILLSTNTSGPIRGFAVTLIIGLVVSLFTSLFCTHAFFDYVLGRSRSLATMHAWLGGKAAIKPRSHHIDFLKHDLIATGAALALVVVVITMAVTKGFNWSVDFAGGGEMDVAFATDVPPDTLHTVAAHVGLPEASIQAVQGAQREYQYLIRFGLTGEEGSEAALSQKLQDAITTDLAAYGPHILRTDYVGPQIGGELRHEGFRSILYAIIGIVAYLALRFDMRFGSGAVFKLVPDTCAMLGFYLFFWRPFDLTSIAALLTGVGYSVNDIVVVYDRIRENMKLHPKDPLRDTINTSINETLTRTVNTSVVTLLSLVGVLIFGTGSIWNFAMAMSVGIVAATLSSNFVGSSWLLWYDPSTRKRRAEMLRPGHAHH